MGYEYRRNEAIIRSKTREFFGVGTVVTATSYLAPFGAPMRWLPPVWATASWTWRS